VKVVGVSKETHWFSRRKPSLSTQDIN